MYSLALIFSFPDLRWGVIALIVFAVCSAIAIATWAALRSLLVRSIPRFNGKVKVQGLKGTVTIKRDRYGVPTIQADSIEEALFGQGYTHAQDRLWQLELNRRVGYGRLSELFGTEALPADIFLRRLSLRRAAESDLEALNDEERSLLEAYCAGVNAGMASLTTLPVEFRLLRFKPEPWQPLDSLIWVQVMSMELCGNWEQELVRGQLIDKLGTQGAQLLNLLNTEAVPESDLDKSVLEGLRDLYQQAREYLPNAGVPGASNAWVVAPEKSATGRPLLASDPHLVGRLPSVWYECRLKAPDLDIQGVGFAAIPFVVIGANRDVAWGITNSFADTQDLYIERFSASDPSRYKVGEEEQTVEVFEERISVKGEPDHIERVETTRHGPLLFRTEQVGLALRWVNYEGSHPLIALKAMNQASSALEFKEALRHWQAPSSNFVFADAQGNIAYLMAGHLPIRKRGTGLTPVPGWTDEFEWKGTIPFEELPWRYNPPEGYIATANNQMVGSDYPHHLTWDWLNPVRAQRIEELLTAQDKFTLDDFQIMQTDTHCATGLRFAKVCAGLEFTDGNAQKARALLAEWDGNGTAESGPMALYQIALLETLKGLLIPLLGEPLCYQFLGRSNNPVATMAGHTGRYTLWLIELMESAEKQEELRYQWPDLPTIPFLLEEALGDAYVSMRTAYGPQPELWQWGFLHRLQFKHPLGINPLLDKLFNGPSVGAGGDTDTVFQTMVSPQTPYTADAWCPSFRQLVELGPEGSYRSVLPSGQSGHPASRNYLDQFLLWCEGRTRQSSGEAIDRLELFSDPDTP